MMNVETREFDKQVAVIGAAGHVGLPFSLVVADAGHKVWGVDVNLGMISRLNGEVIDYVEEGAIDLLRKIKREHPTHLIFTAWDGCIKDCDVVAIMLGTPVDAENNPRMDDLFKFVDNVLIPQMKQGQLIILRSTVSPGTTEVIRDRIEKANGWKEGKDFYLVFCPERVVQGKGIVETHKLPQLIGAFSEASYEKAREFFRTFVDNKLFHLTPREAEIGKLMTNMYRYISFAFANEFWMIAEKQDVDIDKVIDACNYDYPRLQVPHPGPNVGGPCLFKDGRFLLSHVPFADLIQVAFLINEGMCDAIYNKLASKTQIEKVLILGASFKAGSDDIRNSLSFKMRKVCKKHGVEADIYDPYVPEFNTRPTNLFDYSAVIIMTPHHEFVQFWEDNKTAFDIFAYVVDIWKLLEPSKKTVDGFFTVFEDEDAVGFIQTGVLK
jgi:UDP-N-acetyl-D-mannosaminuronic acid dehydrogenase